VSNRAGSWLALGCRLPTSAARAAQPRPQLRRVAGLCRSSDLKQAAAPPTQRSSRSRGGARMGAGGAGQDRGAAGQVEAAGRAPRDGPGGPAARLGRQGAELCHPACPLYLLNWSCMCASGRAAASTDGHSFAECTCSRHFGMLVVSSKQPTASLALYELLTKSDTAEMTADPLPAAALDLDAACSSRFLLTQQT